MNMTMLDWYLTINRQLGYHFLPFNQVILMLNQSFDGMHTNQVTKVKIHGNKVFNMQQEANNFLMSLSRIFFSHKSTAVSMSKALYQYTNWWKEGVKKTSHMSNNHPPPVVLAVLSVPQKLKLSDDMQNL
jgi:hypothetical protein